MIATVLSQTTRADRACLATWILGLVLGLAALAKAVL